MSDSSIGRMTKKKSNGKKLVIISLIMAGGEGVRLWPLSTPENPKPFIKLIGEKSFLRMAYERALMISPEEKIYISTLESLSEKILQELPDFSKKNLILEPIPKNTAPAIALAAMELKKFGEDSVMAVLPADHYIHPLEKFKKAILLAAGKAREGSHLLTFGVKPESPSSEYGYIETGGIKASKGVFKVKRFTEKPNLRKAKSFLRKGNYYWNSGMFIWRIDSILSAIKKFAPDIFSRLSKAHETSKTGIRRRNLKREFSKIQPISIDYAVMEKADNCYMTELKTKWKDFGSWDSVFHFFKKDIMGNFIKGNTLPLNCRNSLIWNENGSLCAFGIENLIVILSKGKLLILDRRRSKEIEQLKNAIKNISSE